MKKTGLLVVVALLTCGCGDDGDSTTADASLMATDASDIDSGSTGVDALNVDAANTLDAAAATMFQLRLVNNLPGLNGTAAAPGGFHVCLWFSNGGTVIPQSSQFLTQNIGPIPFRGVTPRLSFPVIAPLDYIIAAYEPANLGEPAACPDDPMAGAAPIAALVRTLAPGDVPAGAAVTGIVTGLLPDTFGAAGGVLPSICNAAGVAPTFTELCTTAAQMVVVNDDQSPAAAGMTRFRVSNMVSNSSPPTGITLCYDPGLVPMANGSCVDATPGATDETALANTVTYGTVTAYADRTPIVPTGSPTPGVGGGLYIVLGTGSGCPQFSGPSCYPMLDAFPPMTPPLPETIRPQLSADSVNTIFISGVLAQSSMTNFNPSFFIWRDDN